MAEIIDITGRNRHERRSAAALHETATPPSPNRVRSMKETAELAGISIATLYRRIADGTGPRITRMSPRRRGVTDRDRETWLEGCAK